MKNIMFFLIIILMFGCASADQSGNGSIAIKTPSEIYPINKSIIGNGGSVINTDSISQSQYRYEVIVESNGRRIAYAQLKNDTEKTISVPSGIPLDFKIGVYCAKDSNSMDELYNVYLASCSKDNVMVMFGESKNLELKLDLNKQQKVDSYFNSNFGISNITGGVLRGSSNPAFSVYPSANLLYEYIGTNFSTFTNPVLPLTAGKGMIVTNNYDNYWYVSDNGAYHMAGVMAVAWNLYPTLNIKKHSGVISVFNPNNYAIMNYGSGFVFATYNAGIGWTSYDYDFSEFSYIYPDLPYFLDILSAESLSVGNENYHLTVLKTGSYLATDNTLQKFSDGDKSGALSTLRKYIRIPNTSSSGNILITSAEYNDGIFYLGTKQGLYYIDANNTDWKRFLNDNSNGFLTLPESAINKSSEFTYIEPIYYMELLENGTNNRLVICTPNRIWFNNLNNNKSDMITVWDGVNFNPNTGYSWKSEWYSTDYKTHNMAKVNFILWDTLNGNDRFWIGTQYGLSSINLNKLGL